MVRLREADGDGAWLDADGVSGIGGQIDDDLVNLRGVHGDGREARGRRRFRSEWRQAGWRGRA